MTAMPCYNTFPYSSVTVHRLAVGPLQANCYLIQRDGECIIIDPGGDPEVIAQTARAIGAVIKVIAVTHAHFDHIAAVDDLRAQSGAPVFVPRGAAVHYARAAEEAKTFGLTLAPLGAPDGWLDPGPWEAAGITLDVLPTPGHAPGHVAFLHADGFVITGDALFRGSIGRVDLPGGDAPTLEASIREHLLTLPWETAAFPGHGPETTIGREAQDNPFLNGEAPFPP